MTIVATTTPGMEDVAAGEGATLLAGAGYPPSSLEKRPADYPPGTVRWDVSAEISPVLWLDDNPLHRARTLYHVYASPAILKWNGRTLASLVEGVSEFSGAWMEGAPSFRVTCERSGTHPFRSPDVEREVGTALHARYDTPGRMDGYALHLGIEITESFAFIGYRLNRKKDLGRRYDWRYHPRITLRTPIAYLMLSRAGFVDHPGPLYDPCCGSGTILLEAGSVAAESGAAVQLCGSDREPDAVEGARMNLAANGVTASVQSIDLNALRPLLEPDSLGFIVTNPPYGVRIGKRIDYHLLYQSLLSVAAWSLRSGGRLALLVERRGGAFDDVRGAFTRLREVETRELAVGGIRPRLIVLERLPRQS